MNIYLLDLTSISEQDVSEYQYVLDADRQTRIAQYGRSADQRRSFGVGITLLYAWRLQYKEQAMPQMTRDENGKPHFIGTAVPFCLSHSGKYAACVLGEVSDGEIGLDIQEPRRIRAAVAARFFSEGEKEQLRAGENICLIWSRKESLAKYHGSGLRGDLRLLDTAGERSCQGVCQGAESASCRYVCQNAESTSCRYACQGSEGAPCQYACRGAESAPCQYACRGAESTSCRYACQGSEGAPYQYACRDAEGAPCQPACQEAESTSCQTADATAHIWSCRMADGYAVSVCTERAVPCRLVYLTWEQVKGIL